MLNPFPDLLTYSLLAPFVLRVTLALILLSIAYMHLTKERLSGTASRLRTEMGGLGTYVIWYLGTIELIAGISLLVGFLTQIGAILGIIAGIELFFLRKRYTTITPHHKSFYVLIIVMSFSLLLTGAGAIAFDLPL